MQAFDLLVEIPPWIFLATTLALIVSLLFYALFGHRDRPLILYAPAGLIGFFAGDWAGDTLGVNVLQLGDVQGLSALAGAVVVLILLHLVMA